MNLREYRAAASLLAARHKTPESALKDQVMAALVRLPGVDVIRMNTGQANHGGRRVRYGYPGMADLFVRVRGPKCSPYRVLWIELKAGTKQSDAQAAFQQQAEQWGDRYIMATSVDDVLRELEVTNA